MNGIDDRSGWHVRATAIDDLSPLLLILNSIIDEGGTTALEDHLSKSEFAERFLSGNEVLFCHVLEDVASGSLLGFQSVSRHPDLPGTWGDIATFARIRPKVAGVGTTLFPRTVASAKEMSLVTINAAIRADNIVGLSYYSKIGFATYRTLSAVPLKDGRPVDRILKRYDIT